MGQWSAAIHKHIQARACATCAISPHVPAVMHRRRRTAGPLGTVDEARAGVSAVNVVRGTCKADGVGTQRRYDAGDRQPTTWRQGRRGVVARNAQAGGLNVDTHTHTPSAKQQPI